MLNFFKRPKQKSISEQIIDQAIQEGRLLTTTEALYLNQEGMKLIEKLNSN